VPSDVRRQALAIPSPKATTLVAVLSNPPLTSGSRTAGRVELARRLLAFDRVLVANLLGIPTRSTLDVTRAGADESAWLTAREHLVDALGNAEGVLLAFGVQPPGTPARTYFSAQVAWLAGELRQRRLATWTLGGLPRHPSRWQRWTSRAHPGMPFETAVRLGLLRSPADTPS